MHSNSQRVEFDRVSGNNRDHRKTLTKQNMHAGYSAQRRAGPLYNKRTIVQNKRLLREALLQETQQR